MSRPVKIAAFCGSLRKDSLNRKLMNAAVKLAPTGTEIKVMEWGKIPVFNEDDEYKNYSPAAQEIKDYVKTADGVMIVTPEYNFSLPGGLKNTVDYLSRPYGTSPFSGKAVSLMGCNDGKNIGTSATIRSQLAWRATFIFLNMTPVMQPEVTLGAASEKFDERHELKDAFVRDLLTRHMATFVDLAQRLRK